MKSETYINALENRENAVRLFIDAGAQVAEQIGTINDDEREPEFYDDGCIIERIIAEEMDAYRAHERCVQYLTNMTALRARRIGRYADEQHRQSADCRSKMMNPTNMFRAQGLTRGQIEARAGVGREVGKLIATMVKLAHINPTADMEGTRLLNDTLTRTIELMGTSAYADGALEKMRDKTLRLALAAMVADTHVANMLTLLDLVRAAWYGGHPQVRQVHQSRRPVWHQSPWYKRAKAHHTLNPYVSASSDTVGGIAVAETYARLYAQRFTVMKPGRYLLRYFRDVLSEQDIKDWAQRQIGDSVEAVVYFAKTADEIVWAYENSPRSCMKMNRDERYIAEDLDEYTHPVRAYAHPENHLAVAFIMSDKANKPDYGDSHSSDSYPPIAARTIVNTERKCYYRLYGRNGMESSLESALAALGYVYRADTMAGELLSLQRVDEYLRDDSEDDEQRYEPVRKGWTYAAVPYVDGGYCHAVYERTPEGREQLRIVASDHGWVGGLNPVVVQNSAGVVEVDTRKNWYGVETLRGETRI